MTLADAVQFVGAISTAAFLGWLFAVVTFVSGAVRGIDGALAMLPVSIIGGALLFGLTFWAMAP